MTILIEDLTFKTIIGLLPEERLHTQRVIISIKLTLEEESMVVNYATVAQEIQTLYTHEKFATVEDSLTKACSFLKATYPFLKGIWIKVLKPDILPNCHVGATLEKIY